MATRILSVLSHTEYGNLEDSDIGLFASAFAPVTGNHVSLLLSDDAVNYAVVGQDGSGIRIAGGTVQPGFLIETDLRAVHDAGIPVYAFKEDVKARGIAEGDLVAGVTLVSRREYAKLVEDFDTVWNW